MRREATDWREFFRRSIAEQSLGERKHRRANGPAACAHQSQRHRSPILVPCRIHALRKLSRTAQTVGRSALRMACANPVLRPLASLLYTLPFSETRRVGKPSAGVRKPPDEKPRPIVPPLRLAAKPPIGAGESVSFARQPEVGQPPAEVLAALRAWYLNPDEPSNARIARPQNS